jgi:hypothetical protein
METGAIITIIVIWILANLSLILGIGITITVSKDGSFDNVKRRLKGKTKGLGPVNKPSAADLAKRGTIQEQTEQEVETLLDKIIPDEEKPEEKKKG